MGFVSALFGVISGVVDVMGLAVLGLWNWTFGGLV